MTNGTAPHKLSPKLSLKLYSYFRSSAAFRVRAALYWKQLDFEYVPIHLLKDNGQQNAPSYRQINPMAEVPTLVHGDFQLGQSMAIFWYLEELQPSPALFPQTPRERAKVVQLCEVINSGIHPVQNLKVGQELEKRWNVSQEDKNQWCAYWIHRGFTSLEQMLKPLSQKHALGNSVTAADMFIVPQVFNARRYQVDLTEFPIIQRIEAEAMQLEAFRRAEPKAQPDFVPT